MFYKVFCEDDYEIINPINKNDYDLLNSFDGISRKDIWHDFEVTFEAADKGKGKKKSDFPWYMSSVLILQENVILKMKDFFEANGELLPIHSSDNKKLFAFNCNMVDALDEEKSDIIRLGSSGKILLVKKTIFKNEKEIQADIFRLNYKSSPTFVSEKFIEMYKKYNFCGLKFLNPLENSLK